MEYVLPRAGTAGGGRGLGVQRPAPEGSGDQLVRLCQFLAEDRSLDRAAFCLWIEDHPIPLERLRKALARLAPNPKLIVGDSSEQLRDKTEQYAESVRRRKHVQPHVKKMAEDGRLATMLEGFLGMGLGRALPSEEQQRLGADFEELSGLNRARVDHWEGKSPWLTGDTSPQLAVTASLLEQLNANLVKSASEEELFRARDAFKSMMLFRHCAALLQQLHGRNVFGLGAVTDLPIGLPTKFADPVAFLGMIALNRTHPSLLGNMVVTAKSLHATLDALRQQVEAKQNEPT